MTKNTHTGLANLDWTIHTEAPKSEKLERLENDYEALTDTIGPLWGEKQEAELAGIITALRAQYDAERIPDIDRIQT